MNFKLFFIAFLFPLTLQAKTLDDFSLPEFKTGEVFQLSQKVKDRKVVLNFWAVWCTACIKEIGELEALKKKYPEALFVAVNAGDKKKKIKKFLKRYKFSYLILEDKNRKVSKSLGVKELPRTMIIGPKREILYHSDIPPKKI